MVAKYKFSINQSISRKDSKCPTIAPRELTFIQVRQKINNKYGILVTYIVC